MIKNTIKYLMYSFFYYLFRIFPIQNNKIFFQNFNGKGYGENPKYIADEILKENHDLDIVWASSKNYKKDFPLKIKVVNYNSIKAIYEEATSKIWIDNCRKQLYVKKRKKQYYIQTWHGTLTLKKAEKDVEEKLSKYYVAQAKHDSKIIDLFISESRLITELIRSSFWYNGEIFECGAPKHKILFEDSIELRDKVYNYFNLPIIDKIILYTPTFRDNLEVNVYNIDFELILDKLNKTTNKNWIFLLKLHPNIANKSNLFNFNNKIINASNYDDIQELYFASDILITDYSTCMYDFSLLNKPVFLYLNDFEQYRKERDFNIDPYSLPYPCSSNNDELIYKIVNLDKNKYLKELESFFNKVGLVKDINSSKKIVSKIIEIVNNNG